MISHLKIRWNQQQKQYQTKTSQEKKTTDFINIDTKIHNKKLANQIQQCRKSILQHDQDGFV